MIQSVIVLLMSAVSAGLYGAIKYYANKIDGETFDIEKFMPIAILSIGVSIIFALGGVPTDPVGIAEYIGLNGFLVIMANTIYGYIRKRFFPDGILSLI